jgi:hypothetical protein
MMSQKSKQELAEVLRPRYPHAGRGEKRRILDEFVATTGYHRKYAIQVLQHWPRRQVRRPRRATAKYQVVVGALEQVWQVADQVCGKRLVAALPALVAALEQHGELRLARTTRELLLQLSPATADRLLRPIRRRLGPRRGLCTTKPGTLLKQAIRVRTFADLDDARFACSKPPSGNWRVRPKPSNMQTRQVRGTQVSRTLPVPGLSRTRHLNVHRAYRAISELYGKIM